MVSFRKTFSAGPLRFTLGKRGVSTSIGVPGARISLGSDGKVRRTVSLPGTGIYDTQVVAGVRRRRHAQPHAIQWPAPAGPVCTGWQRRLVLARLRQAGYRPVQDMRKLTIGQAVELLAAVARDPRDLWRGGRAWGARGRATREWLREELAQQQ